MLKSKALQVISTKVAGCTKCADLATFRAENGYQTVFGEGHPNARIMIIGEAPGEEEAKQGRPFVGRAGKLLDNIIKACGWQRDQIYIANILKCRPPGNRDPEPCEAQNCRQYLDMQIRCIDPECIICLGRVASINLLGLDPERPMGRIRGEHQYKNRMVICTYHPSYLLRTPSAKVLVWEDLEPVRRKFALQTGSES